MAECPLCKHEYEGPERDWNALERHFAQQCRAITIAPTSRELARLRRAHAPDWSQ